MWSSTWTDGARITFNDARRFGAMDLVADRRRGDASAAGRARAGAAWATTSTRTTSSARLHGAATRRSSRRCWIRQIVAGLGNIYVCEVLYRAGIDPRRKAGRIAATRDREPCPDHPRGAGRGDRGGRIVACATIGRPTANLAISSTPFGSMTARASPASRRTARARWPASCSRADPRSSVPPAKDDLNPASRAARTLPRQDHGRPAMAYETLIVETRRPCRPDPPEPP